MPRKGENMAKKKPSETKASTAKTKNSELKEQEIRLATTPAQHDWLQVYAKLTYRSIKEVVSLAVHEFTVKHNKDLAKLEQDAAELVNRTKREE